MVHPDDDDDPFVPSHHFFAQHLPRDAELMGLDRNTQEGAMIAMAGSLSSAKLTHRVVAWVIVASLTLPLVFTMLSQLV